MVRLSPDASGAVTVGGLVEALSRESIRILNSLSLKGKTVFGRCVVPSFYTNLKFCKFKDQDRFRADSLSLNGRRTLARRLTRTAVGGAHPPPRPNAPSR